ncbi:unnamed protein product [Blepharisma stoltei]|uniref:Protein kinase domain-containing protein n=1 Tax=Blepharisma stoltei TaxID=1481888 RepID=A0AAU9IKD1_9CILI|nr:unnamed protein product [Blepharisma stoltei]
MSTFYNIAEKSEESFWIKVDFPFVHDYGKLIHGGQLSYFKSNGEIKEAYFFLLSSSYLVCASESGKRKKMSKLKWKTIEPFVESQDKLSRYGFRVRQAGIFKDFFTSTPEDLDVWIEHLSAVSIFTDINSDFEIKCQIGQGTFSSVFLATDLSDNQTYAVKSISKSKLKTKDEIAAIKNEIKVMRALNHPNIVKLHRVYESDSKVELVLDYVEGETLFARLIRTGPFDEEYSAKFIEKFLSVLNYLELKKVLHRDIKLENILLSSNNSPSDFKLIDFGLSCFAKDGIVHSCGSPGYVAPEVLKGVPYGNKVDVFSAGVILYAVLSGRPAFAGRTAQDIFIRNRRCMIVFQKDHWKNVSSHAIEFVRRLTEKEPEDRLSSSEALGHEWFLLFNKEKPNDTNVSAISRLIFQRNEKRRHRILLADSEEQKCFVELHRRRGSLPTYIIPDVKRGIFKDHSHAELADLRDDRKGSV